MDVIDKIFWGLILMTLVTGGVAAGLKVLTEGLTPESIFLVVFMAGISSLVTLHCIRIRRSKENI